MNRYTARRCNGTTAQRDPVLSCAAYHVLGRRYGWLVTILCGSGSLPPSLRPTSSGSFPSLSLSLAVGGRAWTPVA